MPRVILDPFEYTFQTLYAKNLFHGDHKGKGTNLLAFASRSKNLFIGAKHRCPDAKKAIQSIKDTYFDLDEKFHLHETELENRVAKLELKPRQTRDGSVVEVRILNPVILQYFEFIERFDDVAYTWLRYIHNRPEQKTHMYGAFNALRKPLRHAFQIPFTYQLPQDLIYRVK